LLFLPVALTLTEIYHCQLHSHWQKVSSLILGLAEMEN
jgi:hypothetical protein